MLKSKSWRKQTCFKIQFYIEIQLTWNVFVILGNFDQSQRAIITILIIVIIFALIFKGFLESWDSADYLESLESFETSTIEIGFISTFVVIMMIWMNIDKCVNAAMFQAYLKQQLHIIYRSVPRRPCYQYLETTLTMWLFIFVKCFVFISIEPQPCYQYICRAFAAVNINFCLASSMNREWDFARPGNALKLVLFQSSFLIFIYLWYDYLPWVKYSGQCPVWIGIDLFVFYISTCLLLLFLFS